MPEDRLHNELVEDQRTRIDLFKWKVILIAGLGAAASGLLGNKPQHPGFLLALIPAVCLYVDLLCRDQTLRIIGITTYRRLAHESATVASYEKFVAKADTELTPASYADAAALLRKSIRSAYALAFIAQDGSTIALLLLLVPWAWGAGLVHVCSSDGIVLIITALLGLLGTAWASLAFARRWAAIEKLPLPN